jgi:hypothetical protein
MQKILQEAYARLQALKDNLPTGPLVEETYVQEYHSILDLLTTASGADLGNFRVPPSQVRPMLSFEENSCERTFLMMKIDGILMLFSLSSQKIQIGFKP